MKSYGRLFCGGKLGSLADIAVAIARASKACFPRNRGGRTPKTGPPAKSWAWEVGASVAPKIIFFQKDFALLVLATVLFVIAASARFVWAGDKYPAETSAAGEFIPAAKVIEMKADIHRLGDAIVRLIGDQCPEVLGPETPYKTLAEQIDACNMLLSAENGARERMYELSHEAR